MLRRNLASSVKNERFGSVSVHLIILDYVLNYWLEYFSFVLIKRMIRTDRCDDIYAFFLCKLRIKFYKKRKYGTVSKNSALFKYL